MKLIKRISAAFLALIMLAIVAGFMFIRYNARNSAAEDPHDHHHGEDGTCCGRHTVCTHGYDNSDLYFDDEELDKFKEKPKEEYSDEDIDEFRNVLYTMNKEEVDQWLKCLSKRRIEVPQQILDEALLILQ